MSQPRLLAPPTTTTPSTPVSGSARPAAAAPASTPKSASYRPPPAATALGATPTPLLDPNHRAPPTSTPQSSLEDTIPKIEALRTRLPDIPYLLSVPWPGGKPNPYHHQNRWEDERGTPFEGWEWKKLQYMSLVTGDCERELVHSRGLWTEEIQGLDPWGNGPPGGGSGGATPWNGDAAGSGGSGRNTVGRGERKKVSFGDYLKKKKDSPNDTPLKGSGEDARRPEVPKVAVNGVHVHAAESESSKSQESRKDVPLHKPDTPDRYAIKEDLPATNKKVEENKPDVTNGHGHPPKASQSSQQSSTATTSTSRPTSAGTEREEGELADEPSIPASIANILKAPIGREPRKFERTTSSVSQLDAGEEGAGGTRVPTADFSSHPSSPLRDPKISPQKAVPQHRDRPREPERPSNKRPLDDGKRTSDEKRQRIDTKPDDGPTSAPKPYTGTSRPHQKQPLPSKPPAPVSSALKPRENERPRKDDVNARRDERRDGSGLGSKSAMPRLLSPLPDHLASANGTPMSKNDSKDSRRARSPVRSAPMQKSDSRDSRRGDRSPPRSQAMQKSGSRDSRRGDDRRERSPARSQQMQKEGSRDSRRGDRSPPRSTPMAKSDSRDSRAGRSPPTKEASAAPAKPRPKMPWEKTSPPTSTPATKSTSSSVPAKPVSAPSAGNSSKKAAQEKEVREDKAKKEPIPMPALMAFDLPPNVEADMKRRLDSGQMEDEAAAAFRKLTGHKRNTSNISAATSGSSGREAREDTPLERESRKTTTQALRERARKPDTPGVARRAVAPKPKARVETMVVLLTYKRNSDMSDTVDAILKTKPEANAELKDYLGRRGRDMITRRTAPFKTKKAESSKRARPSPDSVAEAVSPAKKAKRDAAGPSTPKEAGSGAAHPLAPPSIAKLKQEQSLDNAHTPGSSQTQTPTKPSPPISPTATRAQAPPISPALTDKQRELVAAIRAEYERYIALGTSLKRQRDALIRPSASAGRETRETSGTKETRESMESKEADAQRANIMGAESLLAYLVGFEAMDRAYVAEGARNRGAHWKSLFPYLDSFRLGLGVGVKGGVDGEGGRSKLVLVLDCVAALVGYTGASCLAALQTAQLESGAVLGGLGGGREEMGRWVGEVGGNFRRREALGQAWRRGCAVLAERWPQALEGEKALAWVRCPGGQFGDVAEVRGRLGGIVRELCREEGVLWESKLDF